MKDAEIIDKAYEEVMKKQFETFCLNCISNGEADAVQRYSTGLAIIRKARDKAKEIVGAA